MEEPIGTCTIPEEGTCARFMSYSMCPIPHLSISQPPPPRLCISPLHYSTPPLRLRRGCSERVLCALYLIYHFVKCLMVGYYVRLYNMMICISQYPTRRNYYLIRSDYVTKCLRVGQKLASKSPTTSTCIIHLTAPQAGELYIFNFLYIIMCAYKGVTLQHNLYSELLPWSKYKLTVNLKYSP